jgi:hypothetical protein
MRVLLEAGADATLTKDRTNAAMLVAAGQANSDTSAQVGRADATLEALQMCVDKGVDLNARSTRPADRFARRRGSRTRRRREVSR